MSTADFAQVDLQADEKKIILKLAAYCIMDEATLSDLNNARKKWIRFRPAAISDLIGELSYYFNRSRSAAQSELLDELIGHLEIAENAHAASKRQS